MAVINPARLTYLMTTPTHEMNERDQSLVVNLPHHLNVALRRRRDWSIGYGNNHIGGVNLPMDPANVVAVLDEIRANVMQEGYLGSKGLRPWEYNIEGMMKLDPTQPWWGFEFETGYSSQEDRAEVVGHVWDTWDDVVFDGEGEGYFASEITFSPATASQFRDGTAPAYQFMEYLCQHSGTHHGGSSDVGTHWNLSLPEFRTKLTSEQIVKEDWRNTEPALQLANDTATFLNASLSLSANPDRWERLFGRAYLYGGFAQRGYNGNYYLEGKLFRTTYDFDQFKTYLKTVEALNKIAMLYVSSYRPGHMHDICVNFHEVVDGEEPVMQNRHDVSGWSHDVNAGYDDSGDDYGYSDISDDEEY